VERRLLHRPRLPLATLNDKDFEDFAEHEGLGLLSPDCP